MSATEHSMTNLLRLRYAAPEWAFMSQVRNGTGFTRGVRTADALAMSLYPSRGLHLHGFEIKVSRADFMKELATPEKAEDIARFCSFWWIVAPDTKVAPVEMMPANWGLLVMKGDGLKIAKSAVYKDAVPLDSPMLASISRNVSEATVPLDTLTDWKRVVQTEARAAAEGTWKTQVAALEAGMKRQNDRHNELMRKINVALGCRLEEWNPDPELKTIALARRIKGEGESLVNTLLSLIVATEGMKPALEAAKHEFDQFKK